MGTGSVEPVLLRGELPSIPCTTGPIDVTVETDCVASVTIPTLRGITLLMMMCHIDCMSSSHFLQSPEDVHLFILQ